jgi:hypothetical protein
MKCYNFFHITKAVFVLLALMSFGSGCNSNNTTTTPTLPASATNNLNLQVMGLSQLGDVVIGDYRETTVLVTNNTSDDAPIVPIVTSPFSISKITSPCDSGDLPSGQNCNIIIRFTPTVFGNFSTSLSLGQSTVQISGTGLIGGDITASNYNIGLGSISAGTEYFQSITLTNVGNFIVPFPSFVNSVNGGVLNNNCIDSNQVVQTCNVTLYSNFCGSFLNPGQICSIQFMIIEPFLGPQIETVNMISTSTGAGTSTVPLVFSSVVSPGTATGTISFAGNSPVLTVDKQVDTLITTKPILDEFGNQVANGTSLTVHANNLILDETSTTFTTTNGVISFHIKPTKNKGNATVSVFGGTAFGILNLYVRAGSPFGALTLQPYNQSMIDDGVTQEGFTFKTIIDQYGNIVEDGTQIPLAIQGGGMVSPSLVATFQGVAQFTVTSGTVSGLATVSVQTNPILDINNNILGYNAIGNFPINYIPGPPFGNIPITSGLPGMNAVGDQNLVTIGPVRDSTGNIVAPNTPFTISISNGINLSATGVNLVTDQNGEATFVLQGSGNRGPITVTASTPNSSGSGQVWAYKDAHLTLQGQIRDDWGTGAGSNIINSGRAYTRYAPATTNPANFPLVTDVWDEIFDYSKLANTDLQYYIMQHVNGGTVSSSGNVGNTFPLTIPRPPTPGVTNFALLSQNPNILTFPSEPLIPYFENGIFYSAGNQLMSAPTWSTLKPSGGTNLFTCAEGDGNNPAHDLFNMIEYGSNNNVYSCQSGSNLLTSISSADRNRLDVRSDFYWPLIGYMEDPVGCSFSAGQNPSFNYTFGTFTPTADNTRTIQLFNPNPLPLTALSYAFSTGSDPNWAVTPVDCTTSLAAGSSCTLSVNYTGAPNVAATYSGTINITSNSVSAIIQVSVIIDPNAQAQTVTSLVGTVPLESTCDAKLAIFGGWNYALNSSNVIVPSTNTLLTLYTSTGQKIVDYDNQCPQFIDQPSCLTGNGCSWVLSNPTDPTSKFECSNTIDLGTGFPSRGFGMSPFVQVQRKLYTFSGFDPSGTGQPSASMLSAYDTDSGSWSNISVDPDPALVGQTVVMPEPRYEHAMTYVPETNSLYIFGGVTPAAQDNEPNVLLDDLWAVNLFPAPTVDPSDGTVTPTNPNWTRICQHCGVPTPYTSIVGSATNTGPGYSNTPPVPYMLWDKPNRKMLIYWQGRSDIMYSFDPTATNITFSPISSSSGATQLGGSFQVVYNDKEGRVYGYNRGVPNSDPSLNVPPTINFWDMDSGQTNYFRTRFNLGAGSKTFAQVITPRIKAYGSSGSDPTCGDPCGGVFAYIYNYDTATWDSIGDNNTFSAQQLTSVDEISSSWTQAGAQQHVSTDGFVDILVFTKGSPSYYNELAIDSVYLDGTF